MERTEESHCFVISCCLHGHHVYKEIWMPVIGEQIKTFCEAGKSHDRYAVAVTRVNDCRGAYSERDCEDLLLLIKHKGEITGDISGRKHSRAVCEGMEAPCRLKFYNASEVLKKAKELIIRKFKLV